MYGRSCTDQLGLGQGEQGKGCVTCTYQVRMEHDPDPDAGPDAERPGRRCADYPEAEKGLTGRIVWTPDHVSTY